MTRKPIVIMGPTASGKTELALAVSKAAGGEIISADSRQVYKYLSAGTAKPSGEWVSGLYIVDGVPYHLVDILDPKAAYDAGSFIAAASRVEREISARGKIPVFAGGAGLYLQAYWNGLDVLPKADAVLRQSLQRTAETLGNSVLHAKLREVDPQAAAQIPEGNVQRVIRAIEVHALTGIPVSRLWTRQFYGALPTHKAHFFALDLNKSLLQERISARAHAVFDEMAEETRRLLDSGFPADCPALKSLGYPQVIDFIAGKMTKTDAMHRLITLTAAYAKRQATWFRRYKNAVRLAVEDERERAGLSQKIISACETEKAIN